MVIEESGIRFRLLENREFADDFTIVGNTVRHPQSIYRIHRQLLGTDYTVIGRAANLGARICSVAKGGQVLISQATYDLVKHAVEVTPITGNKFKGVDQDVIVYEVKNILD